jgi:DNA-binding GntR family transcriptional regulator
MRPSDSRPAASPRLASVRSSRTGLADAAYESLLDGLTTGRLQPGDRLVMDVIAEQLGISRTPVRDALQRLEREGLIVAGETRGYIVRSLDQASVRHLYEAREAVEGFAARRIATDRRAVAELDRVLHSAAALDDGTPMGSYLANRTLHRGIVQLTANPILVALADDIWGQSAALMTYTALFAGETEHEDLTAEHVELFDALRSGRAAVAEKAAVAHIRDGMERNLAVLSH